MRVADKMLYAYTGHMLISREALLACAVTKPGPSA
jgi:hypothetical protein